MKDYLQLTKPGIIAGNAVNAAAGFFVAMHAHAAGASTFAAMEIGLALVVGSACVWNNMIDRDIDGLMERTRDRALVRGTVSLYAAGAFATVLGALGAFLLATLVNGTALLAALTGLVAYVILYSLYAKRTRFGTIVGSIAGAMPPVVGYAAVTGRLDSGALILFLVIAVWQMPHFFSIATYRRNEYAAAGIPALPVEGGIRRGKIRSLAYLVALILLVPLFTVFGYEGYVFSAVMTIAGLAWLYVLAQGFSSGTDDVRQGKRVFGFSLVYVTALAAVSALAAFLPLP